MLPRVPARAAHLRGSRLVGAGVAVVVHGDAALALLAGAACGYMVVIGSRGQQSRRWEGVHAERGGGHVC